MKQHEKEFFDSINQIIKEELTNKQILKEQDSVYSDYAKKGPGKGNLGYQNFKQEFSSFLNNLYKIDISGFITSEQNATRDHYDQVLSFLGLENSSFEDIIKNIHNTFYDFFTSTMYPKYKGREEKSGYSKFDKSPPQPLSANQFLGYMIIYKTLIELKTEADASTIGYNFENFCAYLLKGKRLGGSILADIEAQGKYYTCKTIRADASFSFALSNIINYYEVNDSIEFIAMNTDVGNNINYLMFYKRTLGIEFLRYIIKNVIDIEVYQTLFPYNLTIVSDPKIFATDMTYQEFLVYIDNAEKNILIEILRNLVGMDTKKPTEKKDNKDEKDDKDKKLKNMKNLKNQAKITKVRLLENTINFSNTMELLKLNDGQYSKLGEIPIRDAFLRNFYGYNKTIIVDNYLEVLREMMQQVNSIQILTTTGTTDALNNAKTSTEKVKTALEKIKIE
jgi:hypothetical protein